MLAWSANAKLKTGFILVSRIPDIFGRKSGHFQIVAAYFWHKKAPTLQCTVDLWHSFTPNEETLEENKYLFNFMCHIMATFSRNKIRTFYSWKSGNRTKKLFLQLCANACAHEKSSIRVFMPIARVCMEGCF